MEDAITSRLNYSTLDRANQPVRVRLNSTAVKVKHAGEPDSAKEVEITYVRGGKAEKVTAQNVILACYNAIIPYLCPEMSKTQKDALAYCVKKPLVYTSVCIKRIGNHSRTPDSAASAVQECFTRDLVLDERPSSVTTKVRDRPRIPWCSP